MDKETANKALGIHMTEEVYKVWAEEWAKQQPDKQVPTRKLVNDMLELFEIPVDEIMGEFK